MILVRSQGPTPIWGQSSTPIGKVLIKLQGFPKLGSCESSHLGRPLCRRKKDATPKSRWRRRLRPKSWTPALRQAGPPPAAVFDERVVVVNPPARGAGGTRPTRRRGGQRERILSRHRRFASSRAGLKRAVERRPAVGSTRVAAAISSIQAPPNQLTYFVHYSTPIRRVLAGRSGTSRKALGRSS
jgi:hypothetical protein